MPETEPHGLTPFPDTVLKAAKACTVRECDETEKLSFVAYVDEGVETYDVSIQLDTKGNIIKSSCDCALPNSCSHIAALFIFLAENKKITVSVIPKKKATKAKKVLPHEALLEEIESEKLKDWLRDILVTNKELAFAFNHHFADKDKALTAEEAAQATNDAIKTVMGRKKYPDSTQIKGILELWKKLHEPIIERYKTGPADESCFAPLNATLEACFSFYSCFSDTEKLSNYVNKILADLAVQLATLVQDEAFEKASGFFIKHLHKGNEIQTFYFAFLQKLIQDCSPERAQSVARQLTNQYEKLLLVGERSVHASYSLSILQIVVDARIFKEYTHLFKPITYANVYNELLIRALMDEGLYLPAEQWAWAQISNNSNSSFNIIYLEMLRALYETTGNIEGRIKIATEYLPFTFDFDDYLLINSSIENPEEGKAFRKKMFVRARHMSGKDKAAATFTVKLLANEKDWTSMIGYITSMESPLTTRHILEYFSELTNANPEAFLRAILHKRYEDTWRIDREELKIYIEELSQKLIKYYQPHVLLLAILKEEPKNNRYSTSSLLATRLKELARLEENTLFD